LKPVVFVFPLRNLDLHPGSPEQSAV